MSDTEIREGRSAQMLLGNPLFQEAFTELESSLIEKMAMVPMGDIETQHELVLTLQLLRKLKKHFTTIVETGKMAEIQKETMLAKVARTIRK